MSMLARRRPGLVGLLVGTAVTCVLLMIVTTLFVTIEIRSNQQTNHQTEITTQHILQHLKADEESLSRGDATVRQILQEAGAAVQELESLEMQICAAEPGCTA